DPPPESRLRFRTTSLLRRKCDWPNALEHPHLLLQQFPPRSPFHSKKERIRNRHRRSVMVQEIHHPAICSLANLAPVFRNETKLEDGRNIPQLHIYNRIRSIPPHSRFPS